MQKHHLLSALVLSIAALATAGCATAAIPGDDGRAAPVSVGAPSGDSADVGGHTVRTSDGLVVDGAPIGSITDLPAVSGLRSELRRAVTAATEAAASDGVEVRITTGWRSRAYQEALLDEAVAEHGSRAAARKWVSIPDRSAHVSGGAVDIGRWDAMAWMQEHGSAFGLCQTYENEAWHFELATSDGGTCPPMRRDSSAD